MQVIARTDIGKVREMNQDYVKVIQKNENECLAILCDGLGGLRAGEVASALAGETIADFYQQTHDLNDETSIRIWLYQAIMRAHETIYKRSQEEKNLEGMGNKALLVLLDQMVVGNQILVMQ